MCSGLNFFHHPESGASQYERPVEATADDDATTDGARRIRQLLGGLHELEDLQQVRGTRASCSLLEQWLIGCCWRST
eukprot:COSAG04_NODE_2530_length_3971_cov_568.916839_2_plen_77_part_00